MKATIIEGGMTIGGTIVKTGEVFDVMRQYKCSDGTLVLALGRDGKIILPMVCPSKVRCWFDSKTETTVDSSQ